MNNYVSKAIITEISAISRASIKIKDNFFTMEYGEKRQITPDCNIDKEKQLLWDDVNREVENQIQEILDINRK